MINTASALTRELLFGLLFGGSSQMDFAMEYLSFFVIYSEGPTDQQNKRYRHFKTLDGEEYERSELRHFLDGEFARIVKRKAERHPATEAAPTKIGRFTVEPGYELDSNPNYNMIARCREAADKEQYHNGCDDLLRAYIGTSSVRGGAFIVARAALPKYFDAPFLFILKCDFEPKIARITDEESLVGQVDMAISAKSMKSIQYPHMPEDGMLEPGELKIHQASHARYFEEFLAFVSYEQSMPELVASQVMGLVQEYMEQKYQQPYDSALQPEQVLQAAAAASAAGGLRGIGGADGDEGVEGEEERARYEGNPGMNGAEFLNGNAGVAYGNAGDEGNAGYPAGYGHEGGADGAWTAQQGATQRLGSGVKDHNLAYARQQEEQAYEVWAASDKRELQERWDHQTVVEAAQRIVEFQPELEMKFRIDDTFVKTRLADYGSRVHFARMDGRYVVLLEGDSFQFDKDFSPVELLYPEELEEVVKRIRSRNREEG
ncbi:MAG: hypothetical protein K0R57_706 [Paenibacillaceae bacterium]|jgi:hypothetical protein|nr:hypothetical protein [Paenibacillaceae bacterium]